MYTGLLISLWTCWVTLQPINAHLVDLGGVKPPSCTPISATPAFERRNKKAYNNILEVRVGFEPTTLRICSPLHLATLPSYYKSGSGRWIRTIDLQVMSLALYHAALSRYNYFAFFATLFAWRFASSLLGLGLSLALLNLYFLHLFITLLSSTPDLVTLLAGSPWVFQFLFVLRALIAHVIPLLGNYCN